MAAVERCNKSIKTVGMECGKPANFRYYLRGYKWFRCVECIGQEHHKEQWELISRDGMGPKRNTATEELLEQRGNIYGDVRDNMNCALQIMDVVKVHQKLAVNLSVRDRLGVDGCIQMIVHKLARAITGDITYDDNWKDIGGYAELARKIVTGEMDAKEPDSI